jgi:hypothetical protein
MFQRCFDATSFTRLTLREFWKDHYHILHDIQVTVMPTGGIKEMLYYWEEFQYLATKWHPNKAEMNRHCALVEDKCLNHFKNILKIKVNVYLPSLMMKVPDHLYVLGDTYTCHT